MLLPVIVVIDLIDESSLQDIRLATGAPLKLVHMLNGRFELAIFDLQAQGQCSLSLQECFRPS
jgi:hypothetical protein